MELSVNERYREENLKRIEPKTCWHELKNYNLQAIPYHYQTHFVIISAYRLYGQAIERYKNLDLQRCNDHLLVAYILTMVRHVHFHQSES